MLQCKSPCLNCKDRVVGCHSTCEKYKEFFELNEKRKDMLGKDREINRVLHGYNKGKATSSKLLSRGKKKNTPKNI